MMILSVYAGIAMQFTYVSNNSSIVKTPDLTKTTDNKIKPADIQQ